MSLSEAALAALAVDFPQGLPSWTGPFAKAVDQMAELEEKDAERKRLLATNVAQKVALDSSLDALEVLDGKEEERRAEREKMEEAEANLREVSLRHIHLASLVANVRPRRSPKVQVSTQCPTSG